MKDKIIMDPRGKCEKRSQGDTGIIKTEIDTMNRSRKAFKLAMISWRMTLDLKFKEQTEF